VLTVSSLKENRETDPVQRISEVSRSPRRHALSSAKELPGGWHGTGTDQIQHLTSGQPVHLAFIATGSAPAASLPRESVPSVNIWVMQMPRRGPVAG